MNKLTERMKMLVDKSRETSWSIIILFTVLYCIYVTFVNLVLFRSRVLDFIPEMTFGLIDQTLTVNLFSIIVFVSIIIMKYGRLDAFDIGIKRNRIFGAAAAIFLLWVLIQVVNIIFGFIAFEGPIVYDGWRKYGASNMLGSLIAQIFGNCLFEEMAFRGFLMVQICKKLRGRKASLFTGVVLSQMIFSLIHIPNRILGGMGVPQILFSLIIVFMLGVLFAVVYMVTDNLFLAIGIHALWNTPTLVFNGPAAIYVILTFSLLLPLFWNWTFGKVDTRYNSSAGI